MIFRLSKLKLKKNITTMSHFGQYPRLYGLYLGLGLLLIFDRSQSVSMRFHSQKIGQKFYHPWRNFRNIFDIWAGEVIVPPMCTISKTHEFGIIL